MAKRATPGETVEAEPEAPASLAPEPSTAISVRIEDGQTATFRPEAVLAILTKADKKTSTILLQGGMKMPVRGTGDALRKKVFGVEPADVQAAIKQQAARPPRKAQED